jgi:exosome complex RNA-binding protein Csl4
MGTKAFKSNTPLRIQRPVPQNKKNTVDHDSVVESIASSKEELKELTNSRKSKKFKEGNPSGAPMPPRIKKPETKTIAMDDVVRATVGNSVLPGDVVNLDFLSTGGGTNIALGPGRRQQVNSVVVTKHGVLRSRDSVVFWVDRHHKR